MIRINLLPLKESEQSVRRRQQVSMAALAVSLTLLLMVVVYAYQKRTLRHLEDQSAALSAEIAKYDAQTKEARDLETMRHELQSKLKVINDLDEKRVGPAHMLADLSVAVPEKLWLEDFSESHNVVTITGWALDNQTVAAFMRQLEASPYFYKVDLAEATQPDQPSPQAQSLSGVGGLHLKRFVLKASVDYFGRGGLMPQNTDTPGKPALQQEARK